MASTVIQPSIQPVAPFADPVYALKSDNGTFKGLFTQTIGTNNAVMFQSNGYSFSWKPDNILYLDDANNMDVVYGVNSQASAQYWNNKVTYVGTTQLTSDVFECLNNQLKHTVSLVAPPRLPASYMGTPVNVAVGGVITYDSSLSIVADGVKHTTDFVTNGGLSFQDSTDKEVYSLPKIFAQDANGDIADGSYKVTFNSDGTISLYMMVAWSWLQTASYPVAIDPTVVVASAYDTSGNGGRKIVHLSNGWIVASAYYSANPYIIYFYVSKDNGQTWSQLCYTTGTNTVGFAIASAGTNVFLIANINGNTNNNFYTFDASTVANAALTATSQPDSGQSGSFSGTPSIAVDGTGALVASWASKNSTYANSFNIRYSKSTDGGTTWSAPAQITTLNTSGWYAQNPCIVVNSSNMPTIVCETYQGSSVYNIMSATWNGTVWNTVTVYAGGLYSQENSCVVVDSNNNIHVFWSGKDATYTAQPQIKWSESTDGGTTWSAMVNIQPTLNYAQNRPSVSTDTANTLYVFFDGPNAASTYNNIQKVVYNGTSWSAITAVTTNTTANDQYIQTLWSKFNMNSNDAIRYMWQDNQSASVKYDSISLLSSPNAPTLTAHGNFDATVAQTLAWTYSDTFPSDTQSAYQLQIYDVATPATPVIDTGKVASTVSSYTLPANTLTNGHNYQWRVQTWDQSNAQGPYSSYSTFSCAGAPIVTITNPATDGATVPASSLTANWSYSDPSNNAEQSFDVQLTTSADVVLWDSGTITSAGLALTIGYTLANSTNYKVKITATNSLGVPSTQVVRTFTVSYTPPATPTIALTQNTGYIGLAITNPTPGGSQPVIAYNDIYRRKTGTTAWTRIATNIANNGSYSDYAVASGQSYDYKVTAVGNNQTSSDSATSSQSITFRGLMVHQVSNPSGFLNLLYQTQPKNDEWKPEATPLKFAGRTNTVVQFGENEGFTLSGPQTVIMDSDNQWDALNTMIRAKSTLCVRDGRGRKIFAAVVDLKTTDLEFGRQVDLEFVQVDFTEAV